MSLAVKELLLEIDSLKRKLSYYEDLHQNDGVSPNVEAGVLMQSFHLSPVSMAIISKESGCVLEVNQTFCRATGYSRNEIIGKSNDDKGFFTRVDGEELFSEQFIGSQVEVQFFTHSGEHRVAMMGFEEILYGDKTYILASFSDITARKLIEGELRHSKEQLQQIIGASPAPICVSTLKEGLYLNVNESFLKLTGYTREQVVGKTIDDINYLHGVKRTIYVDKLMAGESVNNMDITVKKSNGEIAYCLISAQLYQIDDLDCVLSTVIDITESKLSERALAESEARFHSAFQFSPTMMIIVRADNGQIINANNAWLSTMEYTLEEIIGKNVADLSYWVDKDRYHIVKYIEENGQLGNTELRIRTKTGKILNTLSSAVQTTVNNEQCVLNYSVDITEDKRIHNELARLDRLNLVGQMAASLGHEVRNPMTTVRGFLQMLQSQENNRENQEYYDLMIEEIDHGNRIISEFLALASNKNVDLLPSNLNMILEQVYPLLRAEALLQEKWVNYNLAVIPDLLLDEKEIRQLVINLANNGLEAMAPGGYLEISTCLSAGQVVLGITDQGHGIDPDLAEKLGTPFITTKDNGVGLGLAICYSIAQRHGASIEFDSHPWGTTFWVKFKLY
ncbi:MAG: PAS domain S-box protein [Methylocystaceae bacterium]